MIGVLGLKVSGNQRLGPRGMSVASYRDAMTTQHTALALALTMSVAIPVAAQDVSPAIRLGAACAPVGTGAPSNAPRVAPTGTERQELYNAGQEVAIDSGTGRGLQVGQRFFVRRTLRVRGLPRAEQTVGWLRIVRASESTATAMIDFSCDAVAVGDHLEPYADLVLPPGIDRTDASGRLDPTKSIGVLYGTDGRQLAGDRDFLLADAGQDEGVAAGARYAIYRGDSRPGEARVPFAEAVVVSVFPDKSLLRLTDARDAVSSGDALVPRIGGGRPVARVEPPAEESPSTADVADAASAEKLLHSVEFEDLSFDFDRYTLKPDALRLLDQAAEILKGNPELQVQIEGYSCNIGTEKYNLMLGERRANAVREYLQQHGVSQNRLTAVSYGEERPKYDNGSEESRRLNRRAALVVNIQR